MFGIDECDWDRFQRALAICVTAPFYLTKLLVPHFAPGASAVNLYSSRDRMSPAEDEDPGGGAYCPDSLQLPAPADLCDQE